jgi:putative ABC transport system permease protein
MTPADALMSAVQSLRANLLRSILTMLGIIIGVAAVVIMVAVGSGAETSVRSFIQGLGSNILSISPGANRFGGVSRGAGSRMSLTMADAEAIETEIEHVLVVASTTETSVQLIAGNLNWNSRVVGATPGVFQARDWTLATGRFLVDSDVRGATKNAVIGETIAENLFPGQDPVGQTLRLNRVPFRVVGLLEAKGQTSFGRDQDDQVFVPLTTVRQRLSRRSSSRRDRVGTITVKVADIQWMDQVETDMRELLRARHRISDTDEDDFTIRNLAQIMETSTQATRIMTLLLASIASVSLLVGGIGIMNIMLVSVTERTREIGLRMAVGARGRDIQTQFLIEAVALSLIGGTIGIALGAMGAGSIARFAEWPTVLPLNAVILAFTFSAGVGVFFGLYPARRAAQLDPIEALRYE